MRGLIAALQALPEWMNDNLFRWIANNGFAVVAFFFILALVVTPLFVLIRLLITVISKKIDSAVEHFSSILNSMNTRQEESADMLAAAIRENTTAQAHLGELLAGMSKSQDITLRFITENMVQLAQHRVVVEPPDGGAPTLGVIQPVEKPHEPGA